MSSDMQRTPAPDGVGLHDGVGFTVGQAVRLLVSAWDEPSGDIAGGLYAKAGTKLIVASVVLMTSAFPIAVRHEHVTDGRAFGVAAEEIEPWHD